MKTKVRQHNEWFRPVSLGNRKSCPTCKHKLDPGESLWSWGNYVRAKWFTVLHFCRHCFHDEVVERLTSHTDKCGCTVNLVGYQCTKPDWLTLEPTACEPPFIVPPFPPEGIPDYDEDDIAVPGEDGEFEEEVGAGS